MVRSRTSATAATQILRKIKTPRQELSRLRLCSSFISPDLTAACSELTSSEVARQNDREEGEKPCPGCPDPVCFNKGCGAVNTCIADWGLVGITITLLHVCDFPVHRRGPGRPCGLPTPGAAEAPARPSMVASCPLARPGAGQVSAPRQVPSHKCFWKKGPESPDPAVCKQCGSDTRVVPRLNRACLRACAHGHKPTSVCMCVCVCWGGECLSRTLA